MEVQSKQDYLTKGIFDFLIFVFVSEQIFLLENIIFYTTSTVTERQNFLIFADYYRLYTQPWLKFYKTCQTFPWQPYFQQTLKLLGLFLKNCHYNFTPLAMRCLRAVAGITIAQKCYDNFHLQFQVTGS